MLGYTWGDFSACVSNFFVSGSLPRRLNMTWVTLIPKFKGTTKITKFRPVCMVGCIYKVIAKVLANRLRSVMGSLVDET